MNTDYVEKVGFLDIGYSPEMSAASLGISLQLKKLLTEKTGTLFDLQLSGLIKNNDALVLFDKVSKLDGAHCIHEHIYDSNLRKIYMFDHGVIELSQNKDDLYIQAYSTKKEILLDIKSFFVKNKQSQIKSGYVFAIVSYGGRLALSSIGDAGIPLNKVNYTDKVNADYEYIIQDLKSKSPSGRIVIFDGEPGCHRKGQEILMFDGSIKKVEDITVGDQLMGPDSLPRKVLNLSIGNEEMVEIIPNKGDSWIVNKNHILSLVYSGKNKNREILDVNIQDWNTWSNTNKKRYKLFKTAINFQNNKTLPIDPYLLGILIGDGSVTQNTPTLTTTDQEIVNFLKLYSAKHGMQINRRQYGSKCATYSIVRQKRSKKINPLINKIKKINLNVSCENKFIPFEYKTASRNDRLQLLAGLIDSDGHLTSNGFEIITKSEQLSKDIAFLARSLGFSAYPKKCFKKAQTGNGNHYYRMFIHGETKLIPTIIPRKIIKNDRKQIKNVLRTGFSIRNLPNEDYYGFTLDGDGRFLLGDFTVTHNTGKTHIIRSLLLNVPGAMFVLVPPDMVSSLSGPELLPLLLTQKQSLALNGPIILLLEDADKCLVTRQSDNINSIQSLLNLGDGILGSLLDLRIIATTNAKKIEIEPAILRPGRLSKRVEVNALDAATACKIYEHLLPESESNLDSKFPSFAKFSLAHIYSVAREDGWIPIDRNNHSNNEDEDEDEEFYEDMIDND